MFFNKLLRLFLQETQARNWGLSTSSLLPHSLPTHFITRVTFWWTQTSKSSNSFISPHSQLRPSLSQHPKDSTTSEPSAERGSRDTDQREQLSTRYIPSQFRHYPGLSIKHCCFSPAQTLPTFLLAEATPSTKIGRNPEINTEWKIVFNQQEYVPHIGRREQRVFYLTKESNLHEK